MNLNRHNNSNIDFFNNYTNSNHNNNTNNNDQILFRIIKDKRNYEKKLFSELSLSDKMKIKKEKAKLYLGEKTKRINFEGTNNLEANQNVDPFLTKQSLINNKEPQEGFNVFKNEKNTISEEAAAEKASKNISYKTSENSINIITTSEIDTKKGNDNESFLSIYDREGKDFIIENDKIIILNDRLDEKSKKEIRMLRNRISAQKSRDNKKRELSEYKIFSNQVCNENEKLKNKLSNKQLENELILNRIKFLEENLCQNCQHLRFSSNNNDKQGLQLQLRNETISNGNSNRNRNTSSYNTDNINNNQTSFNINNDNILNGRLINSHSNISSNNYNNNIRNNFSTTLLDISSAARRNISNNFKLGIFSGVLLIFFIVGCLLWGQFDEINNKITRKLFSLYDANKRKLDYSQNNNSNQKALGLISNSSEVNNNNKNKVFNITKSYPIIKYNNKSSITNYNQSDIFNSNKELSKLNTNKKGSDKVTTKLAEYNLLKFNLQSLKSFLKRKKIEFLEIITNKLLQINKKFTTDINKLDQEPELGIILLKYLLNLIN